MNKSISTDFIRDLNKKWDSDLWLINKNWSSTHIVSSSKLFLFNYFLIKRKNLSLPYLKWRFELLFFVRVAAIPVRVGVNVTFEMWKDIKICVYQV